MKLHVYSLCIQLYSILAFANAKLFNWLDAPDKSFQYLVSTRTKNWGGAFVYCANRNGSTVISVHNAVKLISVVPPGSYRINALYSVHDGYYKNGDGLQIVGELPDIHFTDGDNQRSVIMTPGSVRDFRRIDGRDKENVICERARREPIDCRYVSTEGEISLTKGPLSKAYCTADGWTVIQSRGQFGNPTDYFDRKWAPMVEGFGVLGKEYWMGLEKMHVLTNSGKYALRITATDLNDVVDSAIWKEFSIGSASTNYRLNVKKYKGGLGGNSLRLHNGFPFTTSDRPNEATHGNCANFMDAPWWYHRTCYECNLNGINRNAAGFAHFKGIVYSGWRGFEYSLRAVRMEVKVVA